MDWSQIKITPQEIFDAVLQYGSKILIALIVLVIGLWVIKYMAKGIAKLMRKMNVEETLVPFIRSIINIGLKILLIITVIGMTGVQMTSFIAILGALGLAIGLALQGTLQNFAGGVMIMFFKPFKVGDWIEASRARR